MSTVNYWSGRKVAYNTKRLWPYYKEIKEQVKIWEEKMMIVTQ
jgi:hypothetical protein